MGGERTNAERQRRYIARLKAAAGNGVINAPADDEIAKLKAELAKLKAAAKAGVSNTPDHKARIAELEAETTMLRTKCGELQRTRGVMSFQTLSAVSKALHPDFKPSEAERERAYKLFTAWKAGKDKTRPRARG